MYSRIDTMLYVSLTQRSHFWQSEIEAFDVVHGLTNSILYPRLLYTCTGVYTSLFIISVSDVYEPGILRSPNYPNTYQLSGLGSYVQLIHAPVSQVVAGWHVGQLFDFSKVDIAECNGGDDEK